MTRFFSKFRVGRGLSALVCLCALLFTQNVLANVLLDGLTRIGDSRRDSLAIEPTFIVSGSPSNWRALKPSHFHLTESVQVLQIRANALSGARASVYFILWDEQGRLIFDSLANSGNAAVNTNFSLSPGHYQIAVVGQCFNRNGRLKGWDTRCDSNSNWSWDTFSFSGIELISSDSTQSWSFIQRRHAGDGYDDVATGYAGRYYPDYSESWNLTFHFTPNADGIVTDVHMNGLRDALANENYNRIRLRSLSDNSINHSFYINVPNDSGDFSWDISNINFPLSAGRQYEIAVLTGDTGGNDYDDISWDDLVIEVGSPATCPSTTNYTTIYSNDFSSQHDGWTVNNYNRAYGNWPGDSIHTSSSEEQNLVIGRLNGRLAFNGSLTSGGDTEFGSANYDLMRDNYLPSSITSYSIEADLYAQATSSTNNDTGIIFGFTDDRNYYLARWNNMGTSYSSGGSFPGAHRRLEIIRMQNGVPTRLGSSDNFFANDPISWKLTVNGDGISLCVNGSPLITVAGHQPPIEEFGLFSYDNDVGVSWDNIIVKCLDCEQVQPAAHYTFDECSYNDVIGEVIDALGNTNATPFDAVTTQPNGVVQRALELVDVGDHIETSINVGDTWTISTWVKFPLGTTSGNRYYVLGAFDGGGDIFYLDSQDDFRWGVYNHNGSSVDGSFKFNTLSSGWHHLTVTAANDKTRLYIDGSFEEEIALQSEGTLRYIGTSYDNVGTSSAQGMRSPMDEFIIFRGVLSDSVINTYYNNQLNGLNYDGQPRAAVSCSSMIARYRFEQNDFSSGIIDDSGNNNNGTNINGTSIANGRYCRAMQVAASSSSSTVVGMNTQLDVDSDIGAKGTISFWFNAQTAWNQGAYNGGERVLFDGSNASSQHYFALETLSDGRLHFTFEDSSDRDITVTEPSPTQVRSANTWYFITVTWDFENDQYQIFVDGQPRITSNASTNNTSGNFGNLVFGDNSTTYTGLNHIHLPTYYSANGKFDEIRIYNTVQVQADIVTDMNEGFGCTENVDHYRLTYTGTGLTCEAKQLQLQACVDDACTSNFDQPSTVNLAPTGWVGGAQQTFTGNTNVSFARSTAGSVNFSMASSTPSAPLRCFHDGVEDNNCALAFEDIALQIVNPATGSETLPDQISGLPFNLQVKAVKNNQGVCQTLFNGPIDLSMAAECVSPNQCANLATYPHTTMSVASQNVAKNNSGQVTQYSPISTSFSNGDSSSLSTVYYDAGSMRLHVRYQAAGLSISGSNAVRVRPKELLLKGSAIASPFGSGTVLNNNSATGGTTYISGANFDFGITAVNEQGLLTPNYEPGNINLSLARLKPSEMNAATGTLRYADSGLVNTGAQVASANLAFSAGSYQYSRAYYSEVGVAQIGGQDNGYLGNMTVPMNSQVLGRFIPAYFAATVETPGDIDAVCNNVFTYIDQPFNFVTAPRIELTARNALDSTTRNYEGELFKLNHSNSNLTFTDDAAPVVLVTDTLGSIDVGQVAGFDGQHTLRVSGTQLHYQRTPTLVAPFVGLVDQTWEAMQFADTDNNDVCLKSSAADASCMEFVIENMNAGEQRYGRIQLKDTYGPETEDLQMPLLLEYFDGNAFVPNIQDACTAVNSGLFNVNPGASSTTVQQFVGVAVGSGLSTVTLPTGGIGGLGQIDFSAPGDGNVGEITIGFGSNALDSLSWLQFYWDGATLSVPADATATFGRFQGNDRAIYWRERR